MSDNKELVAIVNGKEISKNDVLKYLNDIGPQMAMQFQSPEGIRRVINELVNQELLYLDAVEKDFESDEEFQDVLEITKSNLLKDYAVNKIISKIEATPDELAVHYLKNKDQYNKSETVVASHILVDKIDLANEVIKEIEEGLSFEDAAKKYSSCPSKEAGGNLGEFSKGQMVPEFDEAVFSMEEGELSAPVKTQFGYHIIKLIKKNPAGESEFEDVKEEVYKEVLLKKQQNAYIEKLDELKNKYKVEMF
jgi:peptidyl-prolyl cis-trans isomerase C